MTDDDLMAELRAAADVFDGVPPDVVEAGRAALATLRLDDELAELLEDSAATEPVGVRGADPRVLTFETADVSVELQVERAGGQVSVRGLVTGARDEITVETPDGTTTTPIDDNGWFTATVLPGGALRLRMRAVDGHSITTSWVSL